MLSKTTNTKSFVNSRSFCLFFFFSWDRYSFLDFFSFLLSFVREAHAHTLPKNQNTLFRERKNQNNVKHNYNTKKKQKKQKTGKKYTQPWGHWSVCVCACVYVCLCFVFVFRVGCVLCVVCVGVCVCVTTDRRFVGRKSGCLRESSGWIPPCSRFSFLGVAE